MTSEPNPIVVHLISMKPNKRARAARETLDLYEDVPEARR